MKRHAETSLCMGCWGREAWGYALSPPDCRRRFCFAAVAGEGSLPAGRPEEAQLSILSTSSAGDPVNANMPGTYEHPQSSIARSRAWPRPRCAWEIRL